MAALVQNAPAPLPNNLSRPGRPYLDLPSDAAAFSGPGSPGSELVDLRHLLVSIALNSFPFSPPCHTYSSTAATLAIASRYGLPYIHGI
jgi:hypothetical protein